MQSSLSLHILFTVYTILRPFSHSFKAPFLVFDMPSYCFTALAAVSLLSQYVFAQCTPVDSIKLTAYGYPDGQSDTTSFGCNGATAFQSTTQTPGVAGGAGTYDNPFTLATMEGSTLLTECELVYVPYFKKYYRFQDHCTGCGKFGAHPYSPDVTRLEC